MQQGSTEQKTVSVSARASTAELEARAAIEPLRAAEVEAAGKLGVIKLQLARLEAERDAAQRNPARLERDIHPRCVEDHARNRPA